MQRDILVFADRQDTRGRYQLAVTDDESPVMKRRVLEEDILDQPRSRRRLY